MLGIVALIGDVAPLPISTGLANEPVALESCARKVLPLGPPPVAKVPVVVKGTFTAKPVELIQGLDRVTAPVVMVVRIKLTVLVAVPAGFVTLMGPFDVPAGTVVVMLVAELTVNVALVPLKDTPVALVKLVPVMTTLLPVTPLVGVNEVMVGSGTTVKLVADVAVPPGVVTLMVPVVAPTGTVAVICVLDTTV